MVPDPWILTCIGKGVRSFYARNMGSVGQRAAKLQAIKLWEWFDPWQTLIQADWLEWDLGLVTDFFLRLPTLTANNFEALHPSDPLSTIFKDLNLSKKYIKNQKKFRSDFALLKRPHLHRAYFVTLCRVLITTVYTYIVLMPKLVFFNIIWWLFTFDYKKINYPGKN